MIKIKVGDRVGVFYSVLGVRVSKAIWDRPVGIFRNIFRLKYCIISIGLLNKLEWVEEHLSMLGSRAVAHMNVDIAVVKLCHRRFNKFKQK